MVGSPDFHSSVSKSVTRSLQPVIVDSYKAGLQMAVCNHTPKKVLILVGTVPRRFRYRAVPTFIIGSGAACAKEVK